MNQTTGCKLSKALAFSKKSPTEIPQDVLFNEKTQVVQLGPEQFIETITYHLREDQKIYECVRQQTLSQHPYFSSSPSNKDLRDLIMRYERREKDPNYYICPFTGKDYSEFFKWHVVKKDVTLVMINQQHQNQVKRLQADVIELQRRLEKETEIREQIVRQLETTQSQLNVILKILGNIL